MLKSAALRARARGHPLDARVRVRVRARGHPLRAHVRVGVRAPRQVQIRWCVQIR